MTYVEKTSYFEVAPPGHTIAHKNIENLSKNDKDIPICYIASKYDEVQNFIDIPKGNLML